MIRVTQPHSNLAEKDLGILVDIKLNMRQQCALTTKGAHSILGWARQNIASRSRKVIFPLLSTAESTPGVVCPVLDILASPVKDHRIAHVFYQERLRELGLFSLEKSRFRGDLINICKYRKGVCKEDETRLSSVMLSARTRSKEHKLKCKRFCQEAFCGCPEMLWSLLLEILKN